MFDVRQDRGLVPIINDVFDIAEELKRIDPYYKVFYNKKKKRFEIHHTDCYPTLQLVVPYESLDYRTVLFVQKTRVGRLLNPPDVDEENRLREKKITEKIKEDAGYALKQAL